MKVTVNYLANTTHDRLISILAVDDSAVFLRLVATLLTAVDDIRVVGTAGGAEEALLKATELHPQVILLDIQMPGMSGLDAIPFLRAAIPEADIVMVTSEDETVYRPAALAAGAHGFVSKLKLKTDLLPAIRRAAHRQ